MATSLFWSFAALGATIYCIVQAVINFRERRYVWGSIGLLSAAVFLLSPVQTHSVVIDLSAAEDNSFPAKSTP